MTQRESEVLDAKIELRTYKSCHNTFLMYNKMLKNLIARDADICTIRQLKHVVNYYNEICMIHLNIILKYFDFAQQPILIVRECGLIFYINRKTLSEDDFIAAIKDHVCLKLEDFKPL